MAARLRELGLTVAEKIGKTGVVGFISGTGPGMHSSACPLTPSPAHLTPLDDLTAPPAPHPVSLFFDTLSLRSGRPLQIPLRPAAR